jgi:hypothetical protein
MCEQHFIIFPSLETFNYKCKKNYFDNKSDFSPLCGMRVEQNCRTTGDWLGLGEGTLQL